MLIGVPVAATPGLGPHFDVSVDPPPELEAPPELEPPLELEPPELAVVALDPPPPPDDPGGALVLLPLLPHAASSTAPITTARATPRRTRSACRYIPLTSVLLRESIGGNPPRYGERRSYSDEALYAMAS